MAPVKTVLILSSFVATSRVGGFAQALSLQGQGIEAVVAPTVLFGRHPGLGPPGGGAVGPETFGGVLEGIEATGLFSTVDAVITGYFALPGQVEIAAGVLERVRVANPKALLVVDPILGDADTGLYVKPEVASAIRARLTGLADLITPNAFELGWLAGVRTPGSAQAALALARAFAADVLVTSLPGGPDEIAALHAGERASWLCAHARFETAPRGTGDLLTALFVAAVLQGLDTPNALARAIGGVAEAVEAAVAQGLGNLPVAALRERLTHPVLPVRLETLA